MLYEVITMLGDYDGLITVDKLLQSGGLWSRRVLIPRSIPCRKSSVGFPTAAWKHPSNTRLCLLLQIGFIPSLQRNNFV